MYTHKAESNIFEQNVELEPKKTWQTMLIGRPLATADAPHQTIGKLIGLAVFSSDALSSVAYGPQEILLILSLAGLAAMQHAFSIALGLVLLLTILTVSYEQTIHAYPSGGGAYIVARDNLGEIPALTAAAALLTDYILTVSVSISSGVAQVVSAFPALYAYRVEISVAMILFIMIINLRGVKESGLTFAIPTYFFLTMMYVTVVIGFIRLAAGTLGVVPTPPAFPNEILQPLTLFLILRAFSNGTTSLTGVEAISNGITAFKEPRSHNAGRTLILMACILGSLLLAITFLSVHIGAIPSEDETVISQMARTIYDGRGILYLATIASTTVILMMAANTAFADFPRLSALVAQDGFLPRQLAFRGSRLVFSRGIVTLSLIASLLVIYFQASVTNLLPLYAIGVFLSFTLSQAGMARRWFKSGRLKSGEELVERGSTVKPDKGWRTKMLVNGVGSVCTLLVTFTFAITKFAEGAWVIVIIIPLLVVLFYSIHRHYNGLAGELSLEKQRTRHFHRMKRNRVIMPISGVHQGTLMALNFARSLSDDVTAIHVSLDPMETARVQSKWEMWGDGVRLVVLNSPYRMFVEPLLQFVDKLDESSQPGETITIVVPQFVPRHWWNNFLHARTAETLRKALLNRKNIVITEVPYQVD